VRGDIRYKGLSFTFGQFVSARVMVPAGSLSKMACALGLLFRYNLPFTTLPVSGSMSTFGLIRGLADLADDTRHSLLWQDGAVQDLARFPVQRAASLAT